MRVRELGWMGGARVLAVSLLLATGAVAGLIALADEPAVSVKTTTYKVQGNSVSDLRTRMMQDGPVDEQKRHHPGYTTWRVTWTFGCDVAGGDARLERVNVRVDVKYTLPEWQKPGDADPGLVAKWQDYMAALRKHEDGHRDIGLRAGRRILELLQQSPAAESCPAAGRAANEAGQKILQSSRDEELEYDRVTRHGATQGAVLR